MAHANDDKDYKFANPPLFDRDKFEFQKDRIERFFLIQDADLWDDFKWLYIPFEYQWCKIERIQMNEQQRKDHKNHYGSKNIWLYVISYSEYEKITNKDSVKSIFDSLIKTREENKQVGKSKTLDSIQKDGVFIIEQDESQNKVVFVASKIRTLKDKKVYFEATFEFEYESNYED